MSKILKYDIKDRDVSRGLIRKTSDSVADWGPAIALFALCYVSTSNKATTVALLVVAVGLNAGSVCGSQINHIDLSPNFAGTLMSITNYKWGWRHVQVFLMFAGVTIAYTVRISMSVTIVSMRNRASANSNSPEYDWDNRTSNSILSSFFWGYVITQIPGGYLSRRWSAGKNCIRRNACELGNQSTDSYIVGIRASVCHVLQNSDGPLPRTTDAVQLYHAVSMGTTGRKDTSE
ncbi:hypothetical protein QAD02_020642 [Eretmocerus hayati]|uniref:Uncharacterized protein n=1 Tax=Eretmocerus hayati TaxID=131215 RepID=A0ACC2PMM4_9HYME|nr:hypothetical protein QAD02_020642 [Eretmocerus hayati]